MISNSYINLWRTSRTVLRAIALPLVILSLSASCAQAPSVVKTHEIIEVPTEVFVRVDPRLTAKGELATPNLVEYGAMTDKEKLIHITALYHWNTTRAVQCYGNLDEIGALQ